MLTRASGRTFKQILHRQIIQLGQELFKQAHSNMSVQTSSGDAASQSSNQPNYHLNNHPITYHAMTLHVPGQPLTLDSREIATTEQLSIISTHMTPNQQSLKPGELLLKVSACGVCRTDLQIARGDLTSKVLPIVPGHQIVGRVVASSPSPNQPSDQSIKIGDRVGVGWLADACGTCDKCVSGRENLCEHARFTGLHRDGGFATFVTVSSRSVFAIPDRFTDLEAAPLLCGGIIGYRSLKRSGIMSGQKLGLFGFGASALIALQIALHWKCRVFVCTRSVTEQARAIELGAEWAGSYDDKIPELLDAAVTFAPVGSVVVAALKSLDRGGTVAINAIHLDRIPEFSYDHLWWERSLVSVANYTREDAREFLELAAAIPVKTVSDVFSLADANLALDRLENGQIGGAAVLNMEN